MSNLREVLEYTEEELMQLPLTQLRELLDSAASKERQYTTEQISLKIIINSLYGALANKWFPLFNEKMAQAITGNGRFFIRLLSKNVEEKLQTMEPSTKPYILYNDTDSLYYSIEPFVNMFIAKNPDSTINEQVDFADNFEKKVIAPIIQTTIEEMTHKLNIYNPSVIAADREIISDVAVFVQKKKYFARVRDNEGFRYSDYEPEFKVMGLDLIKSSTPVWSKKKLSESIEHILDKDEQDLRDWLRDTKSEYPSVNPNDMAQVGGVNNLDYAPGEKGIPIGARSALVHNQYVKDNNLEDAYAMIEAGDKTKRMFLKTPNKFNSNIVAYTNDSFIKEFEGLIDYDVMFEKGFINALENMTNALGYNLHKETEELDDW